VGSAGVSELGGAARKGQAQTLRKGCHLVGAVSQVDAMILDLPVLGNSCQNSAAVVEELHTRAKKPGWVTHGTSKQTGRSKFLSSGSPYLQVL
jgi:hypothetical protein